MCYPDIRVPLYILMNSVLTKILTIPLIITLYLCDYLDINS